MSRIDRTKQFVREACVLRILLICGEDAVLFISSGSAVQPKITASHLRLATETKLLQLCESGTGLDLLAGVRVP